MMSIGNLLAGLGAGLLTCPEIGEEFLDYAEKGEFSCKVKVEGYTVVDIMKPAAWPNLFPLT